ncbi:MAG: winged helix-turn-helix domain-containing protein, partial [Candidatus Anstonellales archaeon]
MESKWMKRGRPEEFILSGKAREILLSLSKSPKYFAEILRDVGGSPASINANLRELKEAGLVEDKYTGIVRVVNLTEKGMEAVKYIKMTMDIFEKPEIEEVE